MGTRNRHPSHQAGYKLAEASFPSPPPPSPVDDHRQTEMENICNDVGDRESTVVAGGSTAPSTNRDPLSMELTCKTECARNPFTSTTTKYPELHVSGYGGGSVFTMANTPLSTRHTANDNDGHKVGKASTVHHLH